LTVHLFVTISRFFGFVALRLYSHGPLPESAFHASTTGQRSAGSSEYRRVYVTGQVIGWALVVIVLAAIAVTALALLT
jgi:hypothetical protein